MPTYFSLGYSSSQAYLSRESPTLRGCWLPHCAGCWLAITLHVSHLGGAGYRTVRGCWLAISLQVPYFGGAGYRTVRVAVWPSAALGGGAWCRTVRVADWPFPPMSRIYGGWLPNCTGCWLAVFLQVFHFKGVSRCTAVRVAGWQFPFKSRVGWEGWLPHCCCTGLLPDHFPLCPAFRGELVAALYRLLAGRFRCNPSLLEGWSPHCKGCWLTVPPFESGVWGGLAATLTGS